MNYAWGHPRYIPDFLGIPNSENRPFAELWMGTHPKAPSGIIIDNGDNPPSVESLADFVSSSPREVLGPKVYERFGGLPFLFKLLAAGNSLSIQAHPSKEMAEEGFRREDDAGIPRDAAERNYRDDNHKPEIIMAISTFSAMIGFREPELILKAFEPFLQIDSMKILLSDMKKQVERDSSAALRSFFEGLLLLDDISRKLVLETAETVAEENNQNWDGLQRKWVKHLLSSFPGDSGALAPLFLHIVELQPGEALYQPPGALHAYLEGFGMELMANSDNVLRGGLTAKHIDIPELMKVLHFNASEPQVIKPGLPDSTGIRNYLTPAEEFLLGVADLNQSREINLDSGNGPLIVMATGGEISMGNGSDTLNLSRGRSAFIPWSADNVFITGPGKAAFARVGIDSGRDK